MGPLKPRDGQGVEQSFNRRLSLHTRSLQGSSSKAGKQSEKRGKGRPGAMVPLGTLALGSANATCEPEPCSFHCVSTLLSAVPRPLQSRDLSITLSHDYISCILPGCKRAIAQIHGVTVGSCNQTSLRDFQPNCLGAIFTPTPGKPYTTNS